MSYVGHTPLVNGKRYELTLSAAYIGRDPLGVSAAAPTPTFDPPGPVTFIHQGHIRPFFFILRGFVVQKPQLLCVRAHFRSVDDVGRVNKIDIGDSFAIFVAPLQN